MSTQKGIIRTPTITELQKKTVNLHKKPWNMRL